MTLERRRMANVPAIDGLRGLAVIWIAMGHCWNELGRQAPIDRGPLRHFFASSYMGVDMLFVVSGFVLFLPVVVRGAMGDTRNWMLRRAARIVPAFYVFLVLSYVVSHATQTESAKGAGVWIAHLLFIHGEALNVYKEIGFGVNGAMWTMSVEVIFYACLPLIASWYRRRPILGLVVAIFVAQLWQFAVVRLPQVLSALGIVWAGTSQGQLRMALAFPSYAAHFAIGMTAAWLYVQLRQNPDIATEARVLLVQGAALIAIVANVYLRVLEGPHIAGPFDHWVKTIDRAFAFGVFALATSLAPMWAQWLFRNLFSRLLGVVSYGVYLSHLPLITWLIHRHGMQEGTTSNGDLFKLVALAIPTAFLVGIISYALLEEPARRWARRGRPLYPAILKPEEREEIVRGESSRPALLPR